MKSTNLAAVKIKPEPLIIKNKTILLSKNIRLLLGLIVLLFITACKKTDKISEKIARTELQLEVNRFDREFAEAGPAELPVLKRKYPYLFPVQYPDSIWIAKMNDSLQMGLFRAIDSTFTDFGDEKTALELFFKHIKYYFPEITIPRVVTVSSDVDYKNRVILADTLLLIGLDNYLGMDHRYYSGIDRYIARDLDKRYLPSDVASAYANQILRFPANRSFLSQMIYYGKILYLKDRWMPVATDSEKIHYTDIEIAWAAANEEEIWRYFIERELLYSTDQGLGPRFFDPAPFSKFRLELDSESPARIGRYMGWQIVRDFMENNELTLGQLLSIPPEEIFRRSGYKPNK